MTVVLFLASFQAKKVLTSAIGFLNEANTCKYKILVWKYDHMLRDDCKPNTYVEFFEHFEAKLVLTCDFF